MERALPQQAARAVSTGEPWWPHGPTRPSRRALLALVYAGLLGVATILADSFDTPSGVSVWFPPAALTVVYFTLDPRLTSAAVVAVARFGWALLLAPSPRPGWVILLAALGVSSTYLLAVRAGVWALARRNPSHRPDIIDLSIVLAVGAGAGPLLAAVTNRSLFALTGQTPWSTVPEVAARFWIGDAVAILTIIPALWGLWWLSRRARPDLFAPILGLLLVTAVSLAVLNVTIAGTTPLYLLLLAPLVLALTHGLGGAALAVGATGGVVTASLAIREVPWLDVSAAHLFLIVGSVVILTVGAAVDLRGRLVLDLEMSEHRSRALVEEVDGYAMYTLDASGRIAWWNPGAERLTGYPADEAIGQDARLLDAVSGTDAGSAEFLQQARKEGRATTQGWQMTRDGRAFWADVVLTAISRDGEVVGFTNVTHDLTSRREAEVELEHTARELSLRNRDLQEFAAIASHDLQEPLRMVSSFSELLVEEQRDRLDEDGRRHLGFILDGSRRMQQLVRDLLRYARVGSSGQEATPVDLAGVVDEVIGNLQFAIQDNGAKVEVDPLPVVIGDRSQLVQLMQNLVYNAIHHHPGSAKVRLWTERQGDWVNVHVTDDGPGIPESQREIVFAAFQRGVPTYPGEERGTGIGLAISRRIAERHGGSISISDHRGGTDIVARLRLAPLDLDPTVDPKRSEARTP